MRNLAAIDELLDVVTKTYVDGEISGHNHDHGGLTGLGDDDHTQYLNSTRHAALFDSTLPVALTPDIAGAAGATTVPARRDHVHNVPAAAAVGVSNATSNAEGSSGSFARSDHTHAVTGFALSSHNHSAANITSGTLAVARGGTGIASYTTGNYINASGATTLQQRTPAQVLADIGASASSHTHDTRYYTESEIDSFLAGKSDTSHGHNLAGDVTGTLGATVVGNDSHSHTSSTLTLAVENLSNVTITSVANDEVLAYNGTTWINQTAAEAGLATSGHGHSFSDHGALTGLGDDDHTQYFNSTRHDAHDHSAVLDSAVIDDLSNVTITSVANDEVLAWNGSAWVNQTAAEAGLATSGHGHTLSGDVTGSITATVVGDNSHAHTGSTISALDTADVTTGTFANARIAQSNVTQHQAALAITLSQISDVEDLHAMTLMLAGV